MLPRVFSHVAEFNEAGYQSIPALAFIAEPLILWSPSGSQIETAAKEGVSILDSEDLLDLVKKGFVRIHGRREWLTCEQHREDRWKKFRWAHAKWGDFDDGVREIANEDEAKPADDRRVYFTEPDGGVDWAESQLDRDTEAASVVRSLVANAEAQEGLPPGTREKIDRAEDDEAAARVVLRDIHNHAAAFSEARAVSVEPPAFAPLLSELAGDVIEKRDPNAALASRASLGQTMELFTTLLEEREAPADLSEVQDLLHWRLSDPRIEFEVGSLLCEPSSAAWLEQEISRDRAARKAWDEIFPADEWDFDRAWVFIASLMAAFELTLAAPTAAAALLRFLPRAYSAGKVAMRSGSPAEDYRGPRVPFLLAYGKATPTYGQIGEMRGRLQEFLARANG